MNFALVLSTMAAEEEIWAVGVSQEFPGGGECHCFIITVDGIRVGQSQADQAIWGGIKGKSHVYIYEIHPSCPWRLND